MDGDSVGDRPDPQVDAVVEGQVGVLAEVLDGPLQFASVALRDEGRRQLGVEDDDETVVAGNGRPRPGCCLDLDLVGRERVAGERHRAVRRRTRRRRSAPRP